MWRPFALIKPVAIYVVQFLLDTLGQIFFKIAIPNKPHFQIFLHQILILCSKGTTPAKDSPLKYSTKSFVIQYIIAPSQPHSISVKKQSRIDFY